MCGHYSRMMLEAFTPDVFSREKLYEVKTAASGEDEEKSEPREKGDVGVRVGRKRMKRKEGKGARCLEGQAGDFSLLGWSSCSSWPRGLHGVPRAVPWAARTKLSCQFDIFVSRGT